MVENLTTYTMSLVGPLNFAGNSQFTPSFSGVKGVISSCLTGEGARNRVKMVERVGKGKAF